MKGMFILVNVFRSLLAAAYVMGVDNLRTALRKARDINADEDDWQRIINMLGSGNRNGGNK